MLVSVNIDFELRQCPDCGIHYYVPAAYMKECRENPTQFFHCPAGHSRHFAESEADRLRRERDRLQQRLAEKDDEIKNIEQRRRAALGQVTKLRNRVGNGVCPCCNRSFENLHRHMTTKHPGFKAEAAE